ncbi:hypothetical protein HK105_203949 [Polyrhizophydium stewartii]|uniref:Complex 1 LYR protein domain-containing protein n=1 Tax=Polyrhizophydium stewartii TaxID=2732419 RepID=A0ABR4NAP1_9FUNG|nr:LYR motif-containing protein 5 [Polyrhizophydium stewartii]
MSPLRPRVVALYKQLLYIGREYPLGYEYFRDRLKKAFIKKRDLTDSAEIEKAIKHGEFVYKELEMLWFLRKYRAMRRNYVDEEQDAKIRALLQEYEKL